MRPTYFLAGLLTAFAVACSAGDESISDEGAFSSNETELVTFDFDGSVATDKGTEAERSVSSQLMFLVGSLKPIKATANLGNVTLSNVQTSDRSDGSVEVKYHAKVPVALKKSKKRPANLELVLPNSVTAAAVDAFYEKYKGKCSEHDYGVDKFWHDYTPSMKGCALDPGTVVRMNAMITPAQNTEGRFPEYDRIWSDKLFKAVMIFGKDDSFSKSDDDQGVWAYNQVVEAVRSDLEGGTITPPNTPRFPGNAGRDITFEKQVPEGKIRIVTILVDSVEYAPPEFDARLDEVTGDADLVVYNGHSGLGRNIKALTTKGVVKTGQHQIVMFNACSTFAYLDKTMTDRRIQANPDDPKGTLYLDVISNVMPAEIWAAPDAVLTVTRALMNPRKPQTYNDIFDDIHDDQEIVVTGEEDNKPPTKR